MSSVHYAPNQMETAGHSEHVIDAVRSLGPWQWDLWDDVIQQTMTPLSIQTTANTQNDVNNLVLNTKLILLWQMDCVNSHCD